MESIVIDQQTLIGLLAGLLILTLTTLFYLFNRNDSSKQSIADVSTGLKNEERNTTATSGDKDSDNKVLNPASFKQFSLLSVTNISHNTKLLRFEIPFGRSLDLPIGRHLTVRAEIDGMKVMRAYTPTSRPDQRGYFDLLVKRYDTGKLSVFLHALKVNGSIEVRGPVGRFKYAPNIYKTIGLLAGGTGLTPCLQVIRSVLEGPGAAQDHTNFVLFFQNRKEEDILLHAELVQLVKTYPERLSLVFYLSNPSSKKWGSQVDEKRGYISAEDVAQQMSPSSCQLVCICGPSGFNDAMKKLAEEAGHNESSIYIW